MLGSTSKSNSRLQPPGIGSGKQNKKMAVVVLTSFLHSKKKSLRPQQCMHLQAQSDAEHPTLLGSSPADNTSNVTAVTKRNPSAHAQRFSTQRLKS